MVSIWELWVCMDCLGHGLTESGPFRMIPGFWGAPEVRVAQGAKRVRKALEPAEHECQSSQFCMKGRLHGCLPNRLTKGRLFPVISGTYRTSGRSRSSRKTLNKPTIRTHQTCAFLFSQLLLFTRRLLIAAYLFLVEMVT